MTKKKNNSCLKAWTLSGMSEPPSNANANDNDDEEDDDEIGSETDHYESEYDEDDDDDGDGYAENRKFFRIVCRFF